MQRRDRNRRTGDLAGDVQHPGQMALSRLVTGGDHRQHIGQRPDLHPLIVKSRSLDPGILAVVLKCGVMRISLARVGMQRFIAALVLIPGVLDAFLDPVAKIGVLIGGDWFETGEIALGDIAAGQFKPGSLGVQRQIRHRQIIGDARAVTGPVGIQRAHRRHIGNHRLIDKLAELVDFGLDREQPLQGQGGLAIGIDRIGDAAHRQILDMRGLGAENGDDPVGDPLEFQRLQIMGRSQQIDLRRQLHRRVAPVAAGEHAELSGSDKRLELILHLADVRRTVAPIIGQTRPDFGGGHRIGRQR